MILANLAALWWLVPLGGIILALYLLKMRRKDLKVPAAFLWPPMTEEVRANALFQKLKWNLLLFMQLLALTFIIVALSRPQMRQTGFGGKVTVIVIDTSASMMASDVKPSRFDEAMRICRAMVASVQVGDRVSVVEAGPTPRVVFPLSNDSAKMRTAIDTIEPTDANADVGEALRLAASITSRLESAQIILLSDGVFPEVRNFAPGRASVQFRKIGFSGENAAISAFGLSEQNGKSQLYCGLKNDGDGDCAGTISFFADGKVVDSRKVKIPAGKTIGETLIPPADSQVLEAKLDVDDNLKSDNYAVTINDPHAKVHALLVSNGDIFTERALALDPRIILEKSSKLPESERSGISAYDLILFDGVREDAVHSPAVIAFGSAGSTSPVTIIGSVQTPMPTVIHNLSPIMEAVDLRGTFIDRMQKVAPKPEGQVLAESDLGPLIVYSGGSQKHLYVSFEPMRSDFPLQPSFPILLANAVNQMVPRESVSSAMAINAGQVFSIPAIGNSSVLEWSPEEGPKSEIRATAGAFVIREAKKIGKYALRAEKIDQTVYAMMGSPDESKIAPQDRIMLGKLSIAGKVETTRMGDYWRAFALLGLCVLAFEWWIFARRS